ncbi:hypothetical protein Q0M94_05820 [Deinococcus radiomollis]|uniref:hypothetical protein n=1 Tax=Deinococcus radiomollis TaxID=468916 RepID=UPI00389256EE
MHLPHLYTEFTDDGWVLCRPPIILLLNGDEISRSITHQMDVLDENIEKFGLVDYIEYISSDTKVPKKYVKDEVKKPIANCWTPYSSKILIANSASLIFYRIIKGITIKRIRTSDYYLIIPTVQTAIENTEHHESIIFNPDPVLYQIDRSPYIHINKAALHIFSKLKDSIRGITIHYSDI